MLIGRCLFFVSFPVRMIHRILRLVIILLLLLPWAAWAESPASAIGATTGPLAIEMAPHAHYLLDEKDSLQYADILRGNLSFQPHTKSSFQFSFRKATLWIKFPVTAMVQDRTAAHYSFLVFDNAALGSITLWVPVVRPDGKPDTVELKGGWQQGIRTAEFPFLYPAFHLPEDMDPSRPLIARVSTPYSLQFRTTLYTTDAFQKHTVILFLIVGFFAGVLTAMLLYNIVLYLFMRDRHYIYYILYVFFLLLWQCTLMGLFRYFHHPLGEFLLSYITAWSAFMMMFALIFGIVFLNTPLNTPRHNIVLKAIAAVMGVVVVMTFLRLLWIANVTAYLAGQLGTIFLFTSALAAVRSGFKPARRYLIAVSVFLASAFIFLFRFYGVLPNNTLTMHIMLFGSAAEAILLSIALGYRIRLLREEEHILRERERSLQAMSITDDLTGLFNRRFLNASLVKKIAVARRSNAPLTLLMMDVDHFKRFNDAYGHPEGDQVLIALGRLLSQILREEDIACRYGGEEFVVILHNADIHAALDTAERIRSGFENLSFTPGSKKDIHATVSIGVAQFQLKESPDQLIFRADQALYQAKKEGRNRICSA